MGTLSAQVDCVTCSEKTENYNHSTDVWRVEENRKQNNALRDMMERNYEN